MEIFAKKQYVHILSSRILPLKQTMLTKQQREEKDDTLKNSKAYWIFIGVGAFVFLLIARWAMVNVSNRMVQMREAFWPLMKKALIILMILMILFGIGIVLLNYLGKKDERDDHYQQ